MVISVFKNFQSKQKSKRHTGEAKRNISKMLTSVKGWKAGVVVEQPIGLALLGVPNSKYQGERQ